jgi:hypothetical protein
MASAEPGFFSRCVFFLEFPFRRWLSELNCIGYDGYTVVRGDKRGMRKMKNPTLAKTATMGHPKGSRDFKIRRPA